MLINGYYTLLLDSHLSQHTKKGTYGFPVCGSSNVHAQSPIGAKDVFLSRSLLKVPITCLPTAMEIVLMRRLILAFAVCLHYENRPI